MLDNYIKKEYVVHLVNTTTSSNLRRIYDGERVILQYRGIKVDGGESVRVEFRDLSGNIAATSDYGDDYPQIGLDFMWTYIEKFDKIKSVYLFLNKETWKDGVVKLRSNGDVHVAPCDDKEFTERDVNMMLSYALGQDKVNSKEMKKKVDEVLNWFKSHK